MQGDCPFTVSHLFYFHYDFKTCTKMTAWSGERIWELSKGNVRTDWAALTLQSVPHCAVTEMTQFKTSAELNVMHFLLAAFKVTLKCKKHVRNYLLERWDLTKFYKILQTEWYFGKKKKSQSISTTLQYLHSQNKQQHFSSNTEQPCCMGRHPSFM